MVPCPLVGEQLSLRLDNRLSARERTALEAHLAVCPYCRRLALRLDEIDRLFRRAAPATPSRDLTAAILKAIASPREQRMLGVTLATAGLLASVPSLFLAAAILILALWFTRPDAVLQAILLLVEGIGQFYALIVATRVVLDLCGPWVVSGLSAAFGIGVLGLTVLWGQRVMRAMTPPMPESIPLS